MSAETVYRPILGYCNQLTYRQGDEVEIRAAGRGMVDVDLVRLNHPPDDPDWPVPMVTVVESVPGIRISVAPQEVNQGSYLLVENVRELLSVERLTGSLFAMPTRVVSGHPQALMSTMDAEGMHGFALVIDERGYLSLMWARLTGAPGQLTSAVALAERVWYVFSISIDERSGMAALTQRPVCPTPGEWGRWSGSTRDDSISLHGSETVMVGSARLPGRERALYLPGSPGIGTAFNGKIDSPLLLRSTTEVSRLGELDPRDLVLRTESIVAAWDFGRDQTTSRVVDISVGEHHGELVNGPSRAVTGVSWRAVDHVWVQSPSEYSAVHFHDDDLDDARWPAVASIRLPADLDSAVYAIRLRESDSSQEDLIPIIVSPSAANEGKADVVIVLPSFTYIAYANLQGNGENIDYIASGLAASEPKERDEHRRLKEFEEIGGSLYDVHTDGSGRMYSTPRRPLLTCRPDWKSTWRDAYRHLGADLYIVSWLEKIGVPFDVVTDHVLHQRGSSLLGQYSVVITGTHPEYVSTEMLDAYEMYLQEGGSLLYLGGNGFYWVTTESTTIPELVEVRRGFAGTRTWTSFPGECYHSMTGELGGLWRHRGRPPNALVGVGLAAQGADGGAAPYLRSDESYSEGSFLFEGVSTKVIGEVGFDMGAAAGDEVDRFDVANGSPPWAVVVGSSLELSKYYKLVVEEIQITRENTGGDHEPGVRADLVLIEQESGGFVFSVGSISWVQSMAVGYFGGDTARVTENALRAAMERRRQPRGKDDTTP